MKLPRITASLPFLEDLCDSVTGHQFWGAHGEARDDRQKDLFRPALEDIIDLDHPLVRLAGEIIGRFSTAGLPGQPPLPTRLVAGLFILKMGYSAGRCPSLKVRCCASG